jgi:hypothetical protein
VNITPSLSRRLLAIWLIILACWLAVMAPGTARADAVPATVATRISEARLAGEGELRWLGLKVYAAQLWSGPAGVKTDRLSGQPMALELRYFTSLKGSTIAESSASEIARLGFGDAAQRDRWSAQMAAVFPNVSRGDRLVGMIEPGRGTRFFHNDKPIGMIEGDEFAQAFFSIWLDERTQAPSLRESVLRRSATLAGGSR